MKKELKTERITLRCTPTQKNNLQAEADRLNMPLTTYGTDKLFNGRMRVTYARRKICATLVDTSKYLDEISALIDAEPSDYISKELLLQPLNNARKELSTIWKY